MLRKSIFLMFLVSFSGLSVLAQTPQPSPRQTKAETRPKGEFRIDPSANSDTIRTTNISKGVVNSGAISLPKPPYPAAARAVRAEGAVNVQVLIDEEGNVASANAVSGHPLLRQASEQAALGAKFKPTLLSGQPVKVNGIIVYNFVGPGPNWSHTGFSLGIAETKGVGNRVDLPEDFSDERNQLEIIGKLSPQEQTAQIPNTIALIKSKLSPADLWRFEFGLAKGRILSNAEADNIILTNLAKFKELALNKPEGFSGYEWNRAVELAKFADKSVLTKEDKDTIFSYLR